MHALSTKPDYKRFLLQVKFACFKMMHPSIQQFALETAVDVRRLEVVLAAEIGGGWKTIEIQVERLQVNPENRSQLAAYCNQSFSI